MRTATITCPNTECKKPVEMENATPNSIGVCPFCNHIIDINRLGKIQLLKHSDYLKLDLQTKIELQKQNAITPRV